MPPRKIVPQPTDLPKRMKSYKAHATQETLSLARAAQSDLGVPLGVQTVPIEPTLKNGRPRCSRITTRNTQCGHAAVEGRETCRQHGGTAGRKPVHGQRLPESVRDSLNRRLQRHRELAAATTAGDLDALAPLTSAGGLLNQLLELLDDADALVGLYKAKTGKEAETEEEVLAWRLPRVQRLAGELRAHAEATARVQRAVESREALLGRFEPLIMEFGEGVRRVLLHYIKDPVLLDQVLTGIQQQTDVAIANGTQIVEDMNR